jgi:PHD/YefM family antitoxin component YafN of YafNO toxin-antitoxin module
MPPLNSNRIAFTLFRKELRYHVEHVEHTKEPIALVRNRRVVAFVVPVEMYKILENIPNGTLSNDC